jgi:DNA-binding LacI/PurR family transcriptional regulator
MKHRVTIVEVAKQAGVAVSTVSRVLNGGYASPAVRAKVQEVVRELGFVPSTSARGLKLGRTGLVGFVSWNTHGAWASQLLCGIEDELVGRAVSVVLGSVGLRGTYDASAVRAWIGEHRVDGLVLARVPVEHTPLIDELRAAGLPAVMIASDIDFGYGVRMTVENRIAGQMAAKHLLELGHRRIGFLGGPKESVDSRDRLVGIEEVVRGSGLEIEADHAGFAMSYNPESAIGYAKRWLGLPREGRPTAVVLGNDEMAMQFTRVLLDRGCKIPDDCSIVGFDGVPEAARFWPALTTVSQPLRDMGSAACRVLMQMIDGTDDHVTDALTFKTELIVRESTGPVPFRQQAA